ncbi:hypothetical protein EYF80_036629 [Liparis tanakae]|uniref:Uncharacterized protein n=1 Tax=Liparis tanakae TaxID=230148 RepID=A0A4Z2GHZ7_9TELE|nr:hypothetical protein EYF80_036629 [Liparis tanakae]
METVVVFDPAVTPLCGSRCLPVRIVAIVMEHNNNNNSSIPLVQQQQEVQQQEVQPQEVQPQQQEVEEELHSPQKSTLGPLSPEVDPAALLRPEGREADRAHTPLRHQRIGHGHRESPALTHNITTSQHHNTTGPLSWHPSSNCEEMKGGGRAARSEGTHVADVAQQQHQALPPHDGVVQEEDDEHDEVQDVEGHVSEQRPPGQVQHLPGEDGAHADHEQDVEDGRAHDGADAHVAVGDEDADQGGEELRGGASGRHEGGPGHVVGDRQLDGDDLQPGHEELVADDGQGHEHVDHAQEVQGHPALLPLLHREEVLGVVALPVRRLSGGRRGGRRRGRRRFERLRIYVHALFYIGPVDDHRRRRLGGVGRGGRLRLVGRRHLPNVDYHDGGGEGAVRPRGGPRRRQPGLQSQRVDEAQQHAREEEEDAAALEPPPRRRAALHCPRGLDSKNGGRYAERGAVPPTAAAPIRGEKKTPPAGRGDARGRRARFIFSQRAASTCGGDWRRRHNTSSRTCEHV